MARKNDDGIIVVAHYKAEGDVDWVQAFLRRGPIWSDVEIISREALVEQIKIWKKLCRWNPGKIYGNNL